MTLPYQNATSGDKALIELQAILSRFGCSTFGTMTDAERGCTIVQFRWRDRSVSLEASWRGYAAAWIKANPHSFRMKHSRSEHEAKALAQGKLSVCSILRDWVKAQITAIECGIMEFEGAFLSHMLLKNGQRLIDQVKVEFLALPGGAS